MKKIERIYLLFILVLVFIFIGCDTRNKQITNTIENNKYIPQTPIIDCNYTFEEAIVGTKAPKKIIDQLELITVKYYSMDGKIHQGQILTNKEISKEIKAIFEYILEEKFPVNQAIPIVKYNWNDEKSMEANNTYSFCYRNITYSKHALGLAIDINPMQNPNNWKDGYKYRKDLPVGAVYNPETPGTFTPEHPVVLKFKSHGFFWGYNFKRNHDTHHFEKTDKKTQLK